MSTNRTVRSVEVNEPPAKPEKPKPRFVSSAAREKVVQLSWPLEYDGKVYSSITIRRIQMEDWSDYIRACAKAVDERGEGADDDIDSPFYDAPAAVVNALDHTDGSMLQSETDRFLGLSQTENSPPTGDQSSTESKTG